MKLTFFTATTPEWGTLLISWSTFMPEQSDIAPDFTLPQTDGNDICLSELRGRAVVLFFYPRDDTSGCTKESIGFSEHLQEFADAGAQVYGISKDSIASHVKFSTKHGLKVGLLSDENGSVCEDYGVWREKNMYGRKFMGIERTTFLIAPDGTIAQVWRKVKVPGHVETVLEAVKSL
jgi:thioredoxin-dependent peroxiredoxin